MRIFVSWWTWTWWNAIIEKLINLDNVNEIIVFSRWEEKQVLMQKRINNSKLKFFIGDIRNREKLMKLLGWIDYVIHLAAMKHITKCEENPYEAISINIEWTKNLIEASIYNKVKKFLYVSTDKAVDPYNIYGNTKALWEKLVTNANKFIYNSWTVFFSIRTWNIIWSNWSIIRVFLEQIKKWLPLTITDFSFKRFYIDINDVVNLILYAFSIAKWGEIFVLWWKVYSVKDIYNIFCKIFNKNLEYKLIWWFPWEKKNEVLISKYESWKSYFIDNGKYIVIDNFNNLWISKKEVNFIELSTESYWDKDLSWLESKIRNLLK